MDFAGEKHPVNCPCQKREEKERLDRERIEKRKAEEEAKKLRAEQEERRLEQQKKVDQQIEMKKKQFYRKMNGSGGGSYKTGGSEISARSASTSGMNTGCPKTIPSLIDNTQGRDTKIVKTPTQPQYSINCIWI